MNACFGASAPYKCFAEQNLGAGGIHFRRADQIKGPPRGLTRGEFITCCEEEKLAGLREGRAFRVKDGVLSGG